MINSIIDKFSNDELAMKSLDEFCQARGIEPTEDIEELGEELLIAFLNYYVPELKELSDVEYVQLLKEEPAFSEFFLKVRKAKVTEDDIYQIVEKEPSVMVNFIENYPNEISDRILSFIVQIPNYSIVDHLDNKIILNACIDYIFNESYNQFDYMRSSLLDELFKQTLNSEQIVKLFTSLDVTYINIPTSLINNPLVIKTLLENGKSLPYNVEEIDSQIFEENIDLFIEYISERAYNFDKFKTSICNHKILQELINRGINNFNYIDYVTIDELPILEKNVDKIIELFQYRSINAITKQSSIFFKKTWKSKNLDDFDPNIVIENLDYIFENGYKFSSYSAQKLLEDTRFVRRALECQFKYDQKLDVIKYCSASVFDDNILFAIEHGFDIHDLDKKHYKSKKLNEYVLTNKIKNCYWYIDKEYIENNPNMIMSVIEDIENINNISTNFLYNPKIVKYLYETTKSSEILTKIPSDITLMDEFKDLLTNFIKDGFIIEAGQIYSYSFIRCNEELSILYMQLTQDFKILYGLTKTETLINHLIEIGYTIDEYADSYLLENDQLINNSLMKGDIKYFNNFFKVLNDIQIQMAYQRGYRINYESSKAFTNNSKSFELEFKLGNYESLRFITICPPDDLVKIYFDNGLMIDKTTKGINMSPLAIHLAFEKVNDPNIIELAEGDVSVEDFIKALELGYKVSINAPEILLKNDKLMKVYVDKKLVDSKIDNLDIEKLYDKLLVRGVALVFDDLIKNSQFINLFTSLEISKIVKFVYFHPDSKDKLITIVCNDNIGLVKKVYELCSKIDNKKEFDILMFKQIVCHFSDNAYLCNNFVNSDYTKDDVKLLYKFVVDGVIQNDDIHTIEDLRNYKKINYDNNKNSIIEAYNENSIKGLKKIIFTLLCNKSYADIDTLITNSFNVKKIDELLKTISNEELKEDLKNYQVFMSVIEKIYHMEDVLELSSLAAKLNYQTLNDDPNINNIWNSFKDIDIIAKKFYGEEIKEQLTHFASLKTQEVEEGKEPAIIVTQNKYETPEFVYEGKKYNGEAIDLIELNGTSFLSFAHVLNAYGSGATISDFKNPRLVGRTYICLSAISNEKFNMVGRPATDIDHVTLLFDSFNSEQLALAANKDLNSFGDDNDLQLGSLVSSDFAPVRDVIKTTSNYSYNEYVMYREDNQGNIIYPGGVYVTGEEPTEAEKQAAVYLGVPLVKINKSKYVDREDIKIDYNVQAIEPLHSKEEWHQLRQNIIEIKEMIGLKEEEVEESKKY